MAKDPFWTGVFSAVLGGVVVVAASVGKLLNFMRTGCNTGRSSKRLNGKRNCTQWAPASTLKRMKMGRNRLLVERVENILANTTSQFVETHQSARDTGSSEHGGS